MNRLLHVSSRILGVLVALSMSAGAFVPTAAQAAPPSWTVNMGAETGDQAVQVAYFFPNDITINAGDTITFHYATGEPHSTIITSVNDPGTVLYDSQLNEKGAPDGIWTFNTPGDFHLQCGLHTTMSGTVHVNPAGTPYPESPQASATDGQLQQNALIQEGLALRTQAVQNAARSDGNNEVTAGTDVVHDKGAIFIMRFIKDTLTVKVGDTVTFKNRSEEAPHTFTANEPEDFVPFFPVNVDGPSHATLNSPQDKVNSGFLWKNPPPPSVFPFPSFPPVFQVTFTQPGIYKYYCDLHDYLGMTGKVVVTAR